MSTHCWATPEGRGPVPATGAGPVPMRKCTVGACGSPLERQADAVADAVVAHAVDAAGGAPAGQTPEDDLRHLGGPPALLRRARPGAGAPGEAEVREALTAVADGGTALPEGLGRGAAATLGRRFDEVRIHTDERAGRAARAIGARAFTAGRHIGFAPGEYAPGTSRGRWLLAHELTHVAQQTAGASGPVLTRPVSATVQRQPAPPVAPAALLTEAEIQEAIDYNESRFSDPWTIAIIRELIGIAKYPAVSDRDLALGIARWQDTHPPLQVDGQVGPATTRTVTEALDAASSPALRDDVRVDHRVTATAVNPVVRTVPTPGAPGLFRLDAGFRTTLRSGWIIQELRNTWNQTACGGTVHPTGPTPHYWEAWWVTRGGSVRLPTSLTTPPTHAALTATHDRWQRPTAAGTRGDFTMNARLYAALRLPAGFAFGAVPDALALPATTAAPNSDDLGLVQGRRRATGLWNGCPPPAVNAHTGTP
jgi:hypothetical protein